MNILIVSRTEFNPLKGGIERVTEILTNKLKKKHKILYLCLVHSENDNCFAPSVETFFFPSEDIYSNENIEFYNYFLEKHNINIIINQYGSFRESDLFLNIKNKSIKKISVIHSNPRFIYDTYSSYILSQKSCLKYFKYIFTPLLKYRYLYYRKKHYRKLVNLSDHVVLLSNNYIPLFNCFNNSKITAIPNPCSFNVKNHISSKRKEILYVGKLNFEYKQSNILIRIWEKIHAKYPDWKLIIVGDGPGRIKLEEYVIMKKIERIEFKGFCQPQKYYQTASIFAMTSSNEGFPMVLPEAMQHSCVPIIFNSYAAATDIIDNNINGILIPFKNIKFYIKKTCDLIDNPQLLKKMSYNAYLKSQKFNVHNIINSWEKLFTDNM